jgi:3-oxoacyl-[acyl-carrier-protein] synthase-3
VNLADGAAWGAGGGDGSYERSARAGIIRGARIACVGTSLPERVLTNDEISLTLDTSDEWIRTRTGIRERRIAAPEHAPSDLGAEAARQALERGGMCARDLDLVISSSLVPDMVFPATAALVADRIGAFNAGAFDVQAGCSGFIFALATAAAFVGSGMYRNVLVLGAETVSRALDWQDRATCVLFGDGAGAAVVTPDPESVFTFDLGTDGGGMPILNMPAGGARLPASHQTVDEKQHFLKMNGREVFRFATRVVADSCASVLSAAGVCVEDVDLFVPHQANLRIIDHVAKRIGIAPERVFTNLQRYGNTSCASIPLCLAEAQEAGRLNDGATLLLAGFGAGLSWGTCVTTWKGR